MTEINHTDRLIFVNIKHSYEAMVNKDVNNLLVELK